MMHITIFPRRDHQIPDPSTQPLPQIYDEAIYIEDRIHILDNEMPQLTDERASLLRRWNELKSPAIRNVPPEILSAVFRQVRPPIDFRSFPFEPSAKVVLCYSLQVLPAPPNGDTYNRILLVLGAVCSYWRQVVRSTPELWTTAKLEIKATAAGGAQLLALHMQMSRALPFSMELNFMRDVDFTGSMDLPNHRLLSASGATGAGALGPIRDVLFSPYCSSNLTTLRLIYPPREWLRQVSGAFPQLEDLSLSWWGGTGYRKRLPATSLILPRLRRVTIVNQPEGFVLPWDQITFLHLSNLSIKYCFEILAQCKNLKECKIVRLPSTTLGNFTGPPVVLKYLECLQWLPSSRRPSRPRNVLSRMTLPALRNFYWCEAAEFEGRSLMEGYLNFFTRVSTTITTLEIGGLMFSTVGIPDLHDLFRTIPHLENLILHEDTRGPKRFPRFLEALSVVDSKQRTTQLFLPALKVLVLKGDFNRPFTDLPSLLFEMLEGRFISIEGSGLRIELEKELKWSENCREDFRALVRRAGLRLEIWENDRRVDWI